VDPWTELYLPYFDMIFERPSDMVYYTDKVRMRGEIRDSKVALKTVGYFGQIMRYSSAIADINTLEFDGTVNDMTIKEMRATEKHGTRLSISGHLRNTERVEDLLLQANIKYLSTSTHAAQKLLYGIYPYVKTNVSKYAPGYNFTISGQAHGTIDKLDVKASLRSALGNFDASCALKDISNGKGSSVTAEAFLNTDNLDLGLILGEDKIHQCTIGSKFTAQIRGEEVDLKVDSLRVKRLNLLGYDYSGIAAAGTFSNNSFNGKVISSDPNLSFLFQGIFNLSKKTKNALYKFYFNLGYADLNALHLDKRGASKASVEVSADYIAIESHDLIGNIDVRDLTLENAEGRHKIGDISISSRTSGNEYKINLKSGFADATFVGDKPITSFLTAIKDVTTKKYLPSVHIDSTAAWKGEKYSFNASFGDTRGVLPFVMPDLYLAKGTNIKADIDREGLFDCTLNSQRIALGRNNIKGVKLEATTRHDTLSLKLGGEEFTIGAFKLLNNKLGIDAERDSFKLEYLFDNMEDNSFGDIRVSGNLSHQQYGRKLSARLEPSKLLFTGYPWSIEAKDFEIDSTGFLISAFRLANEEQELTLDGGYSRSRADTLGISFKDFRLEKAMDMIQSKFNLRGKINGNALITSPFVKQAGITLDIQCDSTFIGGHEAGLVKMVSARTEDSRENRFSITNDIKGKSTLKAKGSLYPGENKLAVKVNMDSLCIGYFADLARSTFSEINGTVSGELSAIGPWDNLSVFSRNTRIDSSTIRIAFTNVPYRINGPFHLNDNGIVFDNIDVSDGEGGVGNITGGIDFNHLKDLRMNTHVSLSNIKALDIDRAAGQPIYGKVSADGLVDITGPFDGLDLDISATTSGNGNIGIPLGNSSKVAATELLVFTEDNSDVDPYEEMMTASTLKPKKSSGLGLNINLNVTPEVQCLLVLDRTTDNAITGRGNGNLNIRIPKTTGELGIRGNYTLNEGKFNFTVIGLVSRSFDIKNGSSVSFTGDIMDSDLDIDAAYTTKASLGRLLGDETTGQARSTVNCGLHIYDKLRNPRLKFNIEVPDASVYTLSRLQSMLSTDDKIQRQFLSLIVSNSFLPDDETGIVNNTNVLLSNAAEIMAGQLSNILKMLNIPLDLGFNYQQDKGGTDIFDVAVSTQLFNNRVMVNGSVGNRKNSQSTQDIVGDLDIEMKLTKSGNVRASLFSHSADKYTNYLDDSQRNGLGISYQQEFNNIREFWRNIFQAKKAREERNAEMLKMKDRKMKKITIGSKDERK